MVAKLTQDDEDNNSSNFRCFVDMVTQYDVIYDVIYTILLAEKLFNQYFSLLDV